MIEKYLAGVDPGISEGAIVVINSKGELQRWWTFRKASSGGLDMNHVSGLVWGIKESYHAKFYLEKVHAIFGSSAGSTFKFAEGYGAIQGILTAHGCDWELRTPREWQSKIWREEDFVYKESKKKTKDTKATSLNSFKRLYPNLDLRFGLNEKKNNRRTKQHGGLVDSILIARSQL